VPGSAAPRCEGSLDGAAGALEDRIATFSAKNAREHEGTEHAGVTVGRVVTGRLLLSPSIASET
jgi:hypothetical protein